MICTPNTERKIIEGNERKEQKRKPICCPPTSSKLAIVANQAVVVQQQRVCDCHAQERRCWERKRERERGGGRRLAVMRDREAKQVCLKLALRLTEHAVAENCRWHKQRAVWLHCQKRKPLRWCKSCIQHNFHLPSSVCRSFHLLPPGLTLTNKLPR